MRWTTKQLDRLRRLYGKVPKAEVARRLGVTPAQVRSAVKNHKLGTPRTWSTQDNEYVRENYGKVPASVIANHLGRSVTQVYNKAKGLGITRELADFGPKFEKFLRAKNAAGWSDTEIAAAWKCDRHAVGGQREKLGLPAQTLSEHRRKLVSKKTRAQCVKAGVKNLAEVRRLAFRKYAKRYGWPEDLRPRAVQILQALLINGPMTRIEIAKKIGMPWKGSRKSLVSNDPEGSYLAHLQARGLVVRLGRLKRGKSRGKSTNLYSLSPNIEMFQSHVEQENNARGSGGRGRTSAVGGGDAQGGKGSDRGRRRHGDREISGPTRKAGKSGRGQVCV